MSVDTVVVKNFTIPKTSKIIQYGSIICGELESGRAPSSEESCEGKRQSCSRR
jgi:hypothetical protein